MGSGKSSVGRRIAAATERRFVDTDRLVVDRAGLPIPEIFNRFGESYFRDLESEALQGIADQTGIVVATGGGIILRPENVTLMKQIGRVILLTADEETIFARVSLRSNRPLLKTANPRETISKMLEDRRPIYEGAADFIVDTSHLNHDEVAEAALEYLR